MGHLLSLMSSERSGYQLLDSHEEATTQRTLAEQADWARLWLELLNKYYRGLDRRVSVDNPDDNLRLAQIVRSQFFVLGLGHSKAALDAAIEGNYHLAFFSVRYMAELLVQAAYLRFRPEDARRWYKDLAKPEGPDYPPTFGQAFKKVKGMASNKAAAQHVYDIAKEMDGYGAHPSQQTLLQTAVQEGGHLKLGAHYNPDYCITALDRGVAMTLAMLQEMAPQEDTLSQEWLDEVEVLWQRRRSLLEGVNETDA